MVFEVSQATQPTRASRRTSRWPMCRCCGRMSWGMRGCTCDPAAREVPSCRGWLLLWLPVEGRSGTRGPAVRRRWLPGRGACCVRPGSTGAASTRAGTGPWADPAPDGHPSTDRPWQQVSTARPWRRRERCCRRGEGARGCCPGRLPNARDSLPGARAAGSTPLGPVSHASHAAPHKARLGRHASRLVRGSLPAARRRQ